MQAEVLIALFEALCISPLFAKGTVVVSASEMPFQSHQILDTCAQGTQDAW